MEKNLPYDVEERACILEFDAGLSREEAVKKAREMMCPKYDYECPECKFTEEHQHGMKETVEILCPECLKKPGENSRFKMVKLVPTGVSGHVKNTDNPCRG